MKFWELPISGKRLWFAFCVLLFLCLGLMQTPGSVSAPVSSLSATTNPTTPEVKSELATDKPSVIVKANTARAQVSQTPQKSCSPVNAAVKTAVATTKKPGFHELTDEALYSVYTSNAKQLVSQTASCGPNINGRRYAASTSYSLSWAYSVNSQDGLCKLSAVSVSLNQLFIFPSLASPRYSGWQSTISNLRSHEAEHGQINRSQAKKLYSDLVNFAPTECANISSNVRKLTSVRVIAIKQANVSLDQTSSHGRIN